MASRGARGWRGGAGGGGRGRGGSTYGAPPRESVQPIARRDPYSEPARGADPYAEAPGYPYRDSYGDPYRDPFRDPYSEDAYATDPYNKPAARPGAYGELERTASYGKPGRGGVGASVGRGRGSSSRYPSIGATSGAYKRQGTEYSEVDVKKHKTANIAEMNRLLGESQRDVQSLSAEADASYLSQVLQKQQKLIEMQSKLLAAQEVPSRAVNSYEESGDPSYDNYRESEYFPMGRDQGLYDKPQTQQTKGRGGRGGRGRLGQDRAVDHFSGNSKTADPKHNNELYDPFEVESMDAHAPVKRSTPAATQKGVSIPGLSSAGPKPQGTFDSEPTPRSKPTFRPRGIPPPTEHSLPSHASRDVPPSTSRGVATRPSRGIPPHASRGLPERPPPAALRRPHYDDPYGEELRYRLPPASDPYLEGVPRLPVRRRPPAYESEVLYGMPVDPFAFADDYGEEDAYSRRPPYYEDERLRAYPPPPDPYLEDQYRGAPPDSAGGTYTMCVEGKLNNFMRLLFDYEDPTHAVSAIETTRNRNTDLVKIRTEYNVEDTEDKEAPFVAFLRINGVIMDMQKGDTKYYLKDEVYKRSVYMLLSKSVSEIFANSCKILQSVSGELKAKMNPRNNKGHRFIPSRLKTLIISLREELKESIGFNSGENLIFALDVASGNVDAAITQVYYQKNPENRVRCELYADDLLLGIGESTNKKSSYHSAYRKAKDMLLDDHRSADAILRDNGRLQDVDLLHPEIIDIIYKAKHYSRGSNLFGLKKVSPSNYHQYLETKKDIIVYEYGRCDDNPYRKLEDLALTNRVLLEFSLFSKNSNDEYRCFIFLQGEIIGDAYGHTRMGSRAAAAASALKYLNDNYSIVEVSDRNYKNIDFSFEKAKTRAENLKVEMPQLDLKFDAASYNSTIASDPQPNELTPWVDEAIKSLVNEFHQKNGLEELVIQNDFPEYHLATFKKICQEQSLNIFFKNKESKFVKGAFLVITKELPGDATVMVEMLQGLGNKSGRYKLLQWKDENDVILRCYHK